MDKIHALRQKLRAIQELKEEYLIGSLDAFRYLKAMAEHEKTCDQLAKDPTIGFKLKPSDVSRLQDDIAFFANLWFDLVTLERLSVDSFKFDWEEFHGVDSPLNPATDYRHSWSIDLSCVLQRILSGMNQLPSLFDLWKEFLQAAPFMHCFVLKETNETFSGSDIIVNDRFRPNGNDFWMQMDGFFGNIENSNLTPEQIEKFSKDFKEKNANQCLNIWKQGEFLQIARDIEHWCNRNENMTDIYMVPCPDAWEYLVNPRKLMERAERELTLGRLEIERKVAIGVVYRRIEDGPHESVPELVEEAIQWEQDSLRKRMERLKKLEELLAPDTIIENEKQMLRRARYTYLCVLQNQRWLEKYFSS